MLCNITQNAMGQTPRGVPISYNALQHYPEFHGADTWGVPCQVQPGGVPCQVQPGGYPARGYPAGGYPARGTLPGGTQVGYPPSQVRIGGTLLGQQKEYSLHGGRYASCVHAGGLSCLYIKLKKKSSNFDFVNIWFSIKLYYKAKITFRSLNFDIPLFCLWFIMIIGQFVAVCSLFAGETPQ